MPFFIHFNLKNNNFFESENSPKISQIGYVNNINHDYVLNIKTIWLLKDASTYFYATHFVLLGIELI